MDVIVVELAQNLHAEGTPKKEQTEITGGINLSVIRAEGQDLEEIDFMQRWMYNESGYILDGTHLYLYPDQVQDTYSMEPTSTSILTRFSLPANPLNSISNGIFSFQKKAPPDE